MYICIICNVAYVFTFYLQHYFSNPSKVYRPKPNEKLTKIGSCNYGSVNETPKLFRSKAAFGKELTVCFFSRISIIKLIFSLKIGAIHAPPFSFISQPENRLTGSETILISTIAEKLNFTINYKYYLNVDNLGDVDVSDGHDIYGSGMLNDLLRNNIDIAIGNIVISERVHQNLGVSTTYTVVQVSI